MTRASGALVALVLALASCSPAGPPRPDAASTPTDPVGIPSPAIPTPEARSLTRPSKVIVDNLGEGRFGRILDRSQRDLKELGLWRRLTRELFVIELSARPGKRFIPEDGHLADAFRTLDIRGDQGGVLCDVTFYPAAMTADLQRWRGYYAQGLTDRAPPTLRQLWTAVLAHELVHCHKRNRSEADAARWENKVLAALRAAGVE